MQKTGKRKVQHKLQVTDDESNNGSDSGELTSSSSSSSAISESTSDSSSTDEEIRRKKRRKRKQKRKEKKLYKTERKSRNRERMDSRSPRKKHKRASKHHKSSASMSTMSDMVAEALEKQRIEMEQYVKQIQLQHEAQIKELSAVPASPKRGKRNNDNLIRSPSDTFLYAPAIKRTAQTTLDKIVQQNDRRVSDNIDQVMTNLSQNLSVTDKEGASTDVDQGRPVDLGVSDKNKERMNAAETAVNRLRNSRL